MRKFFSIMLACILLTVLISGCSFSGNKLDGSYEANNGYSTVELEIDGDNALMNLSGQAMSGTIDHSKQIITFKDKNESIKFNYKIVGDKLSLESKDTGTLAFEKESSEKKSKDTKNTENVSESSTSSTDANTYQYQDIFSLETGEYEVGSDIKPGAYGVSFNFNDFSDQNKEDGSGYIEITHDGNVKKYDFEKSGNEKRLILKDGDLINIVPENSDSDFTFMIDES